MAERRACTSQASFRLTHPAPSLSPQTSFARCGRTGCKPRFESSYHPSGVYGLVVRTAAISLCSPGVAEALQPVTLLGLVRIQRVTPSLSGTREAWLFSPPSDGGDRWFESNVPDQVFHRSVIGLSNRHRVTILRRDVKSR
jgi:hypothetical protein